MRNIIIYGAGEKGVFIKRLISKKANFMDDRFNVLYFCDTYKKAGTYVDGTEVIVPEQLNNIQHQIDSVIISNNMYADEIQKEINDLNISVEVYTIPEYVFKFRWITAYNVASMPFFVKIDLDKTRMPYLEIKIVEHCNLKCRGCSVLANISESGFMDIKEFEVSLKRLKELFWGIKDLKLFGGEPLLHPQLKEFVTLARMYFPDSNIVVHSNGLLIPNMNRELFKTMREKDVRFEFTQYPPTGIKKRQIIGILEQNGVDYKFRDALYEFQKSINIAGDYEEEEVYKTCCKCINLIKGTLSCGMGWLIKGLEDKFGVIICEEKFKNSINLFETDLDGWQINEVLDKPFNLCKYCAFMNRGDIDKRMIEWKCGEPFNLSDWVYDKSTEIHGV